MNPVLILYYSAGGRTALLANTIAKGVEQAGLESWVRTVPKLPRYSDELDGDEQERALTAQPAQNGAPYVTLSELSQCSALALGSPVRFGNMAAPLKHFIDSTSSQWLKGSLINKPACVFSSSSSMHGGQETTLLSMMLPLIHHGMIICGLPYSEPELHETETGGTPYGVTHVERQHLGNTLSEHEISLGIAQGKRLAHLAKQLQHGDC